MESIANLFESFKTIFYFKFFGLGKAISGSVKFGRFWGSLNSFEFELYSNCAVRHCAGWACLSVPRRHAASLTPLPPAPRRWHRAPLAPGPTCQPRRAASRVPRCPLLFASPPPPHARSATSDSAAWSHSDPVVRLPHSSPRTRLSSPPSPPPTCLPHRFHRWRPPPPLWFPSKHHCLRRFTMRPFNPPPLSPYEATLTFLLPHRHCRVVPPSPLELPPRRRTPPPEASSTASRPRHRSGELQPRPPCLTPSLWPLQAHR
jgi:hypothetical protein